MSIPRCWLIMGRGPPVQGCEGDVQAGDIQEVPTSIILERAQEDFL